MTRQRPSRAAWLLTLTVTVVVAAGCGSSSDPSGVPAVDVGALAAEPLATAGLHGGPTVYDVTMTDAPGVELSFSCPDAHLASEAGARRRQVYLGTPTWDWNVMATWQPSTSPSDVIARLDERARCGSFEEDVGISSVVIEHTVEPATTVDGVRVWTRVVRLAGQPNVVAETVVTSLDGDTVVLHVERRASTDRDLVAGAIVDVVHALER